MSRNKEELKSIKKFIKKNELKIKIREGWENFSKNIQQPDVMVLDIDNQDALQTLVMKINELNQKKEARKQITYRVAAGGLKHDHSESYSFTPGAEADIIFRLTGDVFRKVKKTSEADIMQVGASIQIGELNKKLYEKYGLILPTASLIEYPTVAGLTGNAGHGTGKDQPGFAGLFSAMTFMLPNGKIVTITEKDPEFTTLRGAHLGLPGIFLSGELKCAKAQKLSCFIDVCSLADFLEQTEKGLFFNHPYTSVMYVPTYHRDELTNRDLKNVVIYTFKPVDMDTPDQNHHPLCNHLFQKIGVTVQEQTRITDLLSLKPELIPLYMRYLVSRGAIGDKDKLVVGDWPSVWHYQTVFPHKINDIDVLFEVSDDSREIIDAFVKMAKVNEKYAQKGEYPVTYAAYARFISGTNGGVSTSIHSKGKHVCGLDIVSSPNIHGYKKYRDEMFDYLVGELNGKPHWGKYAPEILNYKDIYGDSFTEFKTTMENWYKKHDLEFSKSPLLNPFLCNILAMHEYTPIIKRSEIHTVTPSIKPESACKLAEQVLTLIVGDDEDTLKLRKELHVIANSRPDSIFSKKSGTAPKSKDTAPENSSDETENCVIS